MDSLTTLTAAVIIQGIAIIALGVAIRIHLRGGH